MSGPYFESGYIDINYFEGDGVTQSADATLTSSASVTVSGSITRQGDSTLTVNSTHSTEIQRNRFAEVSITDAFNATVSVSISKNLFSTLASQFDWSVTASRIAGNQSTLDSIITLSLQGDRSRALAATTLSSEFTQSTQIDRILTAQSTHNAEFSITAEVTVLLAPTEANATINSEFSFSTQADKLLNAQSDLSATVTVNTQADKILNAQSAVTATSTITATVEKLLSGASTQNLETTLTVTVSKIISGSADFTDAFTSTLTVTVTKNHTADLNTQCTLACEISRTRDVQTVITAEFTQTTAISKQLNAQSNITAETTQTVVISKSMDVNSTQSSAFEFTAQISKTLTATVTATAECNSTITVNRTVSVQCTLSDVFTSTLTVEVTRNHTADLNSAFSISVQADKIGDNTINLNSQFNTTTTADRTRSTTVTITAEISHSTQLDRIRLNTVNINSDITQTVAIGKIVQAVITIESAFEPTLTVTVFRNHTAALMAEFAIQITAQKFGNNIVNLESAFGITAGVDRIRSFTIAIESNHSLNGVISLIKQGNFEQSATFTVQASTGTIKQSEIALSDVFNAQLAVIVFRNHTATLASVTEISAVGTVTRSADISVASTVSTSVNVSITRGFEMQSTAETTQSTQITITRNFVVSVNVLTEISTVINRIQSAEIDIQDAFVTQLTVNISRDNTITATVTVTQSTTVNKIAGVISTISTAVTFNATGARIRFVQLNSTAVSRLGRTGAARTAKTITTVGGAKLSTADPHIGSASVVFDGSGDKLTVPASTDFAFGTGDFCIEFFVKSGATAGVYFSTRNILDFRASNTNTVAPEIYLGSGNTIHYRVNGVDRISVTATTGALPYVLSGTYFTHVAVSRVSGSTRMYVDGVAAATVYTDSNDYVQGGLTIGGVVGASGNLHGNLDEIRIIKGTSPYSGNSITVPYSGLTNTAETVLLIHADGTNNSTNITDDVQGSEGFVENARASRTASAQANIEDAFVSTLTVSIVLGITADLTSTTEFTVLGTRVRLLNQGIGAVSTLASQVDRIISGTADLQSTVTTSGTIDRFRSVEAQFTDVFTAQMSVDVVINSFAVLSSDTALTVTINAIANIQANIQSEFTININTLNSLIATFNLGSNTSLNSVITVVANVQKIKQTESFIEAQFNRVTNFGAVIQNQIVETTDDLQYPGIGTGIAYFDGTDYMQLDNMPIIGTGDYTIEMLAHRSSLLFNQTPNAESDLFTADFNFSGFGVPQLGPHIYIGDDDEVKAGNTYILNGDQITSGGEDRFFTDQNLHIALVRHNGSTRLYLDGVQKGNTLADTVPWTSTTWFIGAAFVGYIDEFRVSTIARYTGGDFGEIYLDLLDGNNSEFRKDSDTAVLLHFNNSLDEGIAQPEKTVDVNATLNTAFTVTAVLSNTRGVDIVAFAESVLSVDTSNVIDYQLNMTVTAQSNITAEISKDFVSELFSNITTQASVEKLKIIDSAVVSEFNFAVDFVKFKNVQLDVSVECTAVIDSDVTRDVSVTVSDQFNVNVLGTRVRFGVIDLQSEFVTTVAGTETEGFAEPVTMTVISTVTVSAESLRIIAVNSQVVSTAVVNVSVLRNAAATLLVNAGKLSAIVVQRYAEISLISQVTLECVITKTTRYNAQLDSAFANNTIIIRQRPGAAVMSTQSTMVVTAIKNISITKTLNAVFSITAEPQPLDQILVVLNIGVISTVTVSGIIVYIEKYELYVREEQRLLNIVSEERIVYIPQETRTYNITDVEE